MRYDRDDHRSGHERREDALGAAAAHRGKLEAARGGLRSGDDPAVTLWDMVNGKGKRSGSSGGSGFPIAAVVGVGVLVLALAGMCVAGAAFSVWSSMYAPRRSPGPKQW